MYIISTSLKSKQLLSIILITLLSCSNHPANKYLKSGDSKRSQGHNSEALIDYNKAIELESNFELAYLNRGLSKYNLRDYYGAISDFNKTIEINPRNEKAFLNRGDAKYYLNQTSEACSDWSKASELGSKLANEAIAQFCHFSTKTVIHFECTNCSEIKFRNPGYGDYDNETSVLFNISVVNNTQKVLWSIMVEYRCLDSSGVETDSGDYEFGGGLRKPYLKSNSVKRENCNLRFPAGGKIVFNVKSYEIWPCPTDDPC